MHFKIHILTDKFIQKKPNSLKFNLSFLFILFATPLFSQAYKDISIPVSIHFTKVKASALLKELNKQTNYKFYYDDMLEQVELESLNYTKAPLGKVLSEMTPLGFGFSLANNSISVRYSKASSNIKRIKQGKITGKVIDEKGQPMPGAGIKIIENGKVIQSSVDGTYSISIDPGTYTLEVSYVSYLAKRIGGILVEEGKTTPLSIAMQPANEMLKQVVVQGSYKKESIAGLYAQQKNAASLTDGISAEQIAKTPDNNVGAVLKRISGVTTLDNKYVVVRGLTERYNQAMIDGIVVPNTDMNRRNFSFDLIPNELVASVVVNKTATPDVSSEFVGGQVIVNTLSIPDQNFLTLSFGSGGNTQTTGKDFLTAGGRANKDYFAFDDGRREKPAGLVSWSFANRQDDPRIEHTDETGYKTGYSGAIEQSKKFDNKSFAIYKNQAIPNQNYRFTLGRVYEINEQKGLKIGFTGGLTYRNTQQSNEFESARSFGALIDGFKSPDTLGRGTGYIFNTTIGAVLNGGIQGEKFKLNLRNLYTKTLNEDFYQTILLEDSQQSLFQTNLVDPVFSSINQHKIEGEHLIGSNGFKLSWSGAYTHLNQAHKDLRSFKYLQMKNTLGKFYQQPNVMAVDDLKDNYSGDYRLWSAVNQDDLNWSLNLSQPFNFLNEKSLLKTGYTGWYKKRNQDVTIAKIYGKSRNAEPVGAPDYIDKYEDLLTPERVGYGLNQAYYWLDIGNGDISKANSKYHAGYLMLDQLLTKKLRLVYGVRAENFNLQNKQEAEIRKREQEEQKFPDKIYQGTVPEQTGEKNWYFLPSANAIYSLTSKMNFRGAYSQTIIRPDFRETQVYGFPDPLLQAFIIGGNIKSTRVQNIDLRYEFYPNPDEIISISAFHKKLDKPAELVNETPHATQTTLTYKNQHSAINYGFEMEWRKSLGIIVEELKNFSLYGNAAVIWSEIKTFQKMENPDFNPDKPKDAPRYIDVIQSLKRPLIGQSPYIINAGLAYQSKYFGTNVSFNRSGFRSYIVSTPSATEFQRPRSLLDLQLSGRILKQKAEIKLNISNILNAADEYYTNANSWSETSDSLEPFKKLKGTDRYEPELGDLLRYRVKYGRSYNLSFTYNF
ncbi:TonB-dependent receptor [Pedobacter panaciterrae]|uniref:TonB-dependent receptor n=1 Tax=Pedobacter panaciterrae TaxID=363849 RepID=UPI00155DC1AD|nr:TonB-dependent receptor [Pedobacter panaciterrae]NQX53156.1 TonB-dependent receptor [Pedobacter panaciterrae]